MEQSMEHSTKTFDGTFDGKFDGRFDRKFDGRFDRAFRRTFDRTCTDRTSAAPWHYTRHVRYEAQRIAPHATKHKLRRTQPALPNRAGHTPQTV